MTSGVTLDVVSAASTWLIVLYRLPLARRAGSSRALWAALVFLALGATLKIMPVNDAVEQVLSIPGSAANLRHFAGAAAAVGVLIEVSHLTQARDSLGRRAVLLAVPTAVAMLAPFAFPPGPQDPALVGRSEWYDASIVSVIHWFAFLTYLGWALVSGAVLCWRSRTHAAATPMRTGITLIGAGMAIGLAYVALKVWMTLEWALGDGAAWLATDRIAESGILAVVMVMICLGCAWQPAAVHYNRLQEAVRTVVALWRLHPLWSVLQTATPRIVLQPDESVHRYNISTPTRLARLLVDRVIEIRDGLIDLEAFADPHLRGEALSAAHRAGLTGSAAQATAEAVMLEIGLRAKAAGGRAHLDAAAVVGAPALTADSAWLIAIARAYATPLTLALADRLTATMTATTTTATTATTISDGTDHAPVP